MKRIFFYTIILTILTNCKQNNNISQINSGVIEYNIQYPKELADQAISNILPEEMKVYFTPNELKFKIKGDLNIFLLEYLSRSQGDSCYTLFKVVNRKLYYPLRKNEKWFLFEKNPPIKFTVHKDSVVNIAGINCHYVNITYPTKPGQVINAYFTKDIKINNKLFNSPFKEIDGIPLQFEVQYNKRTYKFIATKIENSIGNEKMIIPPDYKLSSRQEIHDLVNSILN